MRTALAAIPLLILVLLAWLLQPAAKVPEPEVVPAADAAPTPPPAGTKAPATATPPERQLAPPAPDLPANVRVVTFGSDLGVAGATVRFLPPGFDPQELSATERADFDLASGDPELQLQRFGEKCTTDDAGGCRVPSGPADVLVVARSGALYAEGLLRGGAPTQLQLRPDCTLRVLVVDGAGRPVPGMRVRERLLADTASAPAPQGRAAVTDDAGRYLHPHVQTLAGSAASCVAELQALPPGGEGPAVRVELTAPPPEVVLQLPATGNVTVHLRDAQGRPLSGDHLLTATVTLTTFDQQPTSAQTLLDRPTPDRETSAAIDGHGDAAFPFVALGCWLGVRPGSSADSVTAVGPTLETPAVEVTLQESPDDVIVAARLRQTDGGPFARQKFSLSLRTEDQQAVQMARTDAEGRMRINFTHYVVDRRATLTFATAPGWRGEAMALELPPQPLQAGVNDLGDLQLQAPAILVAGRLVCDPGVERSRVSISIERGGRDGWSREYNLRPEWQADGSFCVRSGIPAGEPLRLSVQDGPYLPVAPIECKSGDTGVDIHLRMAGSAEASFLVDADTPVDLLAVQLTRIDPPARTDPRADRAPAPSLLAAGNGVARRFWNGLEPGTYRLTAECDGSGAPFLTLDAIAIGAGECSDPRLLDIDLRGRARALEVRATGPDGMPVADAEAFVIVQGKGSSWCGYNLQRGAARIAAAGPVDLLVLAKDCEMARAAGVTASCTIPLLPARPTTLQVALPAPLPEGAQLHLRFVARLGLPDRTRIRLDTGLGIPLDGLLMDEVVVGADGSVTVPARWPGEYSVRGVLLKGENGMAFTDDFAPPRLRLPSAGTATLRVGQRGFERALQRLPR